MSTDLHTALKITQRIGGLGTAVLEQFFDVIVGGERLDEQNSNALRMISETLRDMDDLVDDASVFADRIDTYLNDIPEGSI